MGLFDISGVDDDGDQTKIRQDVANNVPKATCAQRYGNPQCLLRSI